VKAAGPQRVETGRTESSVEQCLQVTELSTIKLHTVFSGSFRLAAACVCVCLCVCVCVCVCVDVLFAGDFLLCRFTHKRKGGSGTKLSKAESDITFG
jgi:hypothetical protein